MAYSPSYHQLLAKRKTLPVWECKAKFLQMLDKSKVVILVGETGTGKTTQVPQWCLEYAQGKSTTGSKQGVACTQTSRFVAKCAAQRVADEMDVTLGQEVGYSVRFEDCTTEKTQLKYTTDGMLIQEAIADPLLEQYGVIILDEAHQRTLNTDILMGVIKGIQKRREDLKVIVMSTCTVLDAGQFEHYFEESSTLKIPRHSHPVETIYTRKRKKDHVEAAVKMVLQMHTCEREGDVLLFLAQQQEIEDFCQRLSSQQSDIGIDIGEIKCVPLHPGLSPDQHKQIYDPAPSMKDEFTIGRKVIVTTSIAETSFSVDGIAFVIDCGFVKQKVYNPHVHSECEVVSLISQSSAKQRLAHASHTGPGKCFRLYTEKAYHDDMMDKADPEILRSNLTMGVLLLKKLGVKDVMQFDFLDAPAPERLLSAAELLCHMTALNDSGEVTEIGSLMSEFPLDPRYSKMLLASIDHNCTEEILTIIAMLSVPEWFIIPSEETEKAAAEAKAKLTHPDGDHLTLLNVFRAFKENGDSEEWCQANFIQFRSLKSADNTRKQLSAIMDRLELKRASAYSSNDDSYINVRKALVTAFFMQVAHRDKSGHYMTVKDNQIVDLHPLSCLLDHKPEWVVYNDYVLNAAKSGGSDSIRTVTEVNPQWLLQYASSFYDLGKFPQSESKEILEHLAAETQTKE